MAINKTVNKSTKTHGAMRNCMEYVLRESKINSSLVYVSGPFDAEEITYDTVYRSFLEEKKLWNKDSGRMYAHNIISWHKDEEITPEEAYEFGKEFVEQWFAEFQTLMAVHVDRNHIHLHMVTNTVSYIDGHKLHTTKNELEEMKQLTNRMCEARGWSTPEKGKNFYGNDLEMGHVRAWSKDKYHMLLHNAKESYVAACALAILEAKADACSQDDFVRNMKQKGWHVIWKPTRKNITFVNEEGKKVRDRNILKTFNINVTKGELLDEFIRNDERRNDVMRDDEEERNRRAAEDAELAGYYQQVQDTLEGTGTGDSAERFEDIPTGEVMLGERRSIREALATKGRTKGTLGVEDRKREEQLPIPEQQAKRNRRRAR